MSQRAKRRVDVVSQRMPGNYPNDAAQVLSSSFEAERRPNLLARWLGPHSTITHISEHPRYLPLRPGRT